MKLFKIEGIGDKKQIKVIEEWLDKIEFEEWFIKIKTEAIVFGIPFQKTKAYKDFCIKMGVK